MVLDEPRDKDKEYEYEGFKIVVEEALLEQTGGVRIDFADNYFGGGFNIQSIKPLGSVGESACGGCSC